MPDKIILHTNIINYPVFKRPVGDIEPPKVVILQKMSKNPDSPAVVVLMKWTLVFVICYQIITRSRLWL